VFLGGDRAVGFVPLPVKRSKLQPSIQLFFLRPILRSSQIEVGGYSCHRFVERRSPIRTLLGSLFPPRLTLQRASQGVAPLFGATLTGFDGTIRDHASRGNGSTQIGAETGSSAPSGSPGGALCVARRLLETTFAGGETSAMRCDTWGCNEAFHEVGVIGELGDGMVIVFFVEFAILVLYGLHPCVGADVAGTGERADGMGVIVERAIKALDSLHPGAGADLAAMHGERVVRVVFVRVGGMAYVVGAAIDRERIGEIPGRHGKGLRKSGDVCVRSDSDDGDEGGQDLVRRQSCNTRCDTRESFWCVVREQENMGSSSSGGKPRGGYVGAVGSLGRWGQRGSSRSITKG